SNSTGFSVTHTQEFDGLRDLFSKNKKKKNDHMKNELIIRREDEVQDTVRVEPVKP
ncbi:MAG: hypothetical protein JWO58_2192, partial [Chitinophagaceae bacterium]|nr:hypothetical protein [Chitinophagaceae bacterium]